MNDTKLIILLKELREILGAKDGDDIIAVAKDVADQAWMYRSLRG